MADSEQVEPEAEQPEEFMNRAARRAAKGKKHGHSDSGVTQTGGQPHGRGTVPARKSFGNRRSGG
ncbi:hypothetical protein BJ973_005140 [Actinoplanes tereljensis]|uniref:DUF5302 domain-containing protein n=1 Tax=Paractinoplanes tereljensis TaxID=571912 RepID=A0A919NMV8_9ACTN|nr:hypothetical protein [Actinoplanes tereljensis]GIF21413.1 hypothetical protein Ate02nite_41430 [Actinoplanes tereljensis]